AAFQRRHPLLEGSHGRVGDAAVDMARYLEVEKRGGMVGILEHERRGEVDGDVGGPGARIGLDPGMQCKGLEPEPIRPDLLAHAPGRLMRTSVLLYRGGTQLSRVRGHGPTAPGSRPSSRRRVRSRETFVPWWYSRTSGSHCRQVGSVSAGPT